MAKRERERRLRNGSLAFIEVRSVDFWVTVRRMLNFMNGLRSRAFNFIKCSLQVVQRKL